jgi:antirestriction protein ArdC
MLLVVKALKSDKNAIFKAASAASAAADYLLQHQKRAEQEPLTHAERINAEAQERSAQTR